jgi:hypothetical protein
VEVGYDDPIGVTLLAMQAQASSLTASRIAGRLLVDALPASVRSVIGG